MSRRTYDLFERDSKTRWNIIFVAMMATFTSALLLLTNGISIQTAQVFSAIIGGTAYFVQIVLYKRRPRVKRQKAYTMQLGNSFTPFAALSATALLVFALSLGAPHVQAKVLNKRLQAILESPPTPKRNVETRRVLNLARDLHTKLHPDLFQLATDEMKQSKDPSAWAAYLSALDYKSGVDINVSSNVESNHGAMDIDRLHAKDSSFTGFEIVYRGGQLDLDNVSFQSVTFKIADNENGRKFAEAVSVALAKGNTVTISLR